MTDDEIKSIQEHIWKKYVEGAHDDFDEEDALRKLEEFHKTNSVAVASDTYYLGILYFEMAFEQDGDERRNLFLARAATILDRYVKRTGDEIEDIVDRLDDARSQLEELSNTQRKKLLDKVGKELDSHVEEQEKAQAAAEPTIKVVDGMVYVPAGTYLSGKEKVVKETKAFWIDVLPVTNSEYRRFVETTNYRPPKFWLEGRLRNDDLPVVGISWFDAYKYGGWVGKSLASKEQWEKAARGRAGRIYPWGDEFLPDVANFGREDGSEAVEAVGARQGNVSEFGVRDMAGNVWQWTDSPDPNDPEQRVICGGSWVDPPTFLRSDEHLSAYPKDKYDNIGFRCVRLAKE